MNTVANILKAAAKAEPTVPVLSIWNALCVYMDPADHLAAAERLADAVSGDWRDFL